MRLWPPEPIRAKADEGVGPVRLLVGEHALLRGRRVVCEPAEQLAPDDVLAHRALPFVPLERKLGLDPEVVDGNLGLGAPAEARGNGGVARDLVQLARRPVRATQLGDLCAAVLGIALVGADRSCQLVRVGERPLSLEHERQEMAGVLDRRRSDRRRRLVSFARPMLEPGAGPQLGELARAVLAVPRMVLVADAKRAALLVERVQDWGKGRASGWKAKQRHSGLKGSRCRLIGLSRLSMVASRGVVEPRRGHRGCRVGRPPPPPRL